MHLRHIADPRLQHWQAVKRVLHYVKGTLDHSITYYHLSHLLSTLQPVIYSDSSYADCLDTGRSTQGYMMMLSGGPVAWSAKKQDVVTLSTTESEYIAMVHAGQTALWTTNL